MAGKRNRFARTGLDFIRACRRIKMNFKSEDIQFASLEQVMGTLSHLRKKEGVVFETKLPILAGMGDQCYPFARDVRFPLEPEMFSLTYSWFDMDILREFGLSPTEENVSFDFTEDAVWEMFLLSEITRHLPLYWHAGYASVRYILCKKDLKDLQAKHAGVSSITNLQGFSSLREARKMESYTDVSELLPNVTLVSDSEAVICLTEWCEWGGLSQRTIRVKKARNGLRFLKPKVKYLVKYDCGICF